MNFYGYKRPDGRVGVRNKVLILPASVCASDTTRIISQQVVGSVTFNNQLGCSQVAPDQQFTMDVMAGYAANPNIYGTVVVSLGCENCQMDLVVKAIEEEAGSEASAKELVEILDLIEQYHLPAIFTEANGSDATANAVSRETGVKVAQLTMLMSAEAVPVDSDDPYRAGLEQNVNAILEAYE